MTAITFPGSIASYFPVPNMRNFATPHSGEGSFEATVDTDTSNSIGDKSKSASQSMAAAATIALNTLNDLAAFAKPFKDNPYHLEFSTFTIDRNTGETTSIASLDASGNLEVHGSGSSGGANSHIDIFEPSTPGADWGVQARANLAHAAYALNSILDQASVDKGHSTVDVSA